MHGGGIGANVVSWILKVLGGPHGEFPPPFSGHATLGNGLVSYWKLDELSGQRLDSIPWTVNNLTDNNTVSRSAIGPGGTVALFSAVTNESLSCAALVGADAAVTVAAWCLFGDDNRHTIFDSGNDGHIYLRAGGSTHGAQFSVNGFTVTASLPAGTIQSANWHLIAGTYDPTTDTATVWVDGENSATATGGPNGTPASFIIGNRTGNVEPMQGNISRAGIWSRALSQADLQSLYNSGSGKAYANLTTADKVGLISYWNLTEASGTRADSHGSNTLADNNTVTSETSFNGAKRNVSANFVKVNQESLSTQLEWSTTNIHVALWARSNQDIAGTSGSLITKHIGGVPEWRIWTGNVDGTTDRVYLAASSVGQNEDVNVDLGVASLPFGQWRMVEMRRNGSTIGVAVNGGAFTDGSLNGVNTGDGVLRLGAREFALDFFNGRLEEVGVWNRVLTAQERTDLWNSGDGLFY